MTDTQGPGTSSTAGDTRGAGPASAAPEVVFDRVDMSYDRAPVLRDVSFTAPAGSTTVLMGPSGVGKTTLIRGLLGLRELDHGEITVGGVTIDRDAQKKLQDVRNTMGVMLGGNTVHDGSVFASMTAWENVRYPLEARGQDEATIEAKAWQRMIEFDLTEHVHHYPHELSGGIRRRLAMARAFVDDPVMIVLDDPGTALDLTNRDEIIGSIHRARQNTRATVILTCHDIDMAKTLGDRLVVILGGTVVADGDCAELLDGVYESEDFDERFQFKAAYAAETGNSMDQVKADHDFRALFERLSFTGLIALAFVSLAGVILLVILTAEVVY